MTDVTNVTDVTGTPVVSVSPNEPVTDATPGPRLVGWNYFSPELSSTRYCDIFAGHAVKSLY